MRALANKRMENDIFVNGLPPILLQSPSTPIYHSKTNSRASLPFIWLSGLKTINSIQINFKREDAYLITKKSGNVPLFWLCSLTLAKTPWLSWERS